MQVRRGQSRKVAIGLRTCSAGCSPAQRISPDQSLADITHRRIRSRHSLRRSRTGRIADKGDSCRRSECDRRKPLPVFAPAAPSVCQRNELPRTGHWQTRSAAESVAVIRCAEAGLERCGRSRLLLVRLLRAQKILAVAASVSKLRSRLSISGHSTLRLKPNPKLTLRGV